MTYAELFSEIKGKFMGTDVSDIHEHLAYQFNIEDEEAGGSFYVEVKDGVLKVEPYDYYDRDAQFISTPDVLLKIAEGEMDPVWAFTTQKLRVEGNTDKALRLKEIIEMKKKQAKAAEKEAKKEAKAAEKEAKKEAKAEEKEVKAVEKEIKKEVKAEEKEIKKETKAVEKEIKKEIIGKSAKSTK